MTDIALEALARRAQEASRELAKRPGAERTNGLVRIARELRDGRDAILRANEADVRRAREGGRAESFVDRLALNDARIEGMASAVEEIAAQDDPVGAIEEQRIRPNGLRVGRMRIPLGVVAMIYEARPNVTSDAAALCVRSGNAVLLRGGRDASESNRVIGDLVRTALDAADLPRDAVLVLADTKREQIAELLSLQGLVDLAIPRGGEGLIRYVTEHARVPVIQHFKGVCHVYLDASAKADMAERIVINAKTQRTSVCNAAETLLVHRDAAPRLLPRIGEALLHGGVTLHACPRSREHLPEHDHVVEANDEDWGREYLSLDLAVRVVDSLDEAVAHIARYGSDHTEAIVTESYAQAHRFTTEVSSSCVLVNASTRFADGGQLGLGAEIGISTSKLHAYGPMGARELTTTKFVVFGEGQIRA